VAVAEPVLVEQVVMVELVELVVVEQVLLLLRLVEQV
jgi:hypothetical protein